MKLKMSPKAGFFLWVILPFAISCAYYAFGAAERYVSHAQIVVRHVSTDSNQQLPGLAMLFSGVNPASREETLYVREYINSQDMFDHLERAKSWTAHYSGHWSDPLYYLSETSSREKRFEFFQQVVNAQYDDVTGLLGVTVQSFDQTFGQQLLSEIIAQSEIFVNSISHKLARDQLTFAEREFANARTNYEARRRELVEFQSKNNVLDAQASAESRGLLISELETTLVRERAILNSFRASLSEQSPQIKQQTQKIASLSQQLKRENERLVSDKDGPFNVTANKYRNLVINAGVAEEGYKLSVAVLENARIEANKKMRSLITVVSPNKPETAVFPLVVRNLVTIFLVLTLLFGAGRFILATIRDHKD